jgi:ring-1,2-phenylacetyl-CoA epoxidase subunit PaaD
MVTAAGLAAARAVAAAVPDPELPMVTVADLGILRDVATEGERLVVTITPTYSGCPALREIAHDLRRRLAASGFAEVDVRTALAPAWSSDWITADGRRKLSAAGIAPPHAAPARSGSPSSGASRSPARAAARRIPRGPRRSARPRARRCSGARAAVSPSST